MAFDIVNSTDELKIRLDLAEHRIDELIGKNYPCRCTKLQRFLLFWNIEKILKDMEDTLKSVSPN